MQQDIYDLAIQIAGLDIATSKKDTYNPGIIAKKVGDGLVALATTGEFPEEPKYHGRGGGKEEKLLRDTWDPLKSPQIPDYAHAVVPKIALLTRVDELVSDFAKGKVSDESIPGIVRLVQEVFESDSEKLPIERSAVTAAYRQLVDENVRSLLTKEIQVAVAGAVHRRLEQYTTEGTDHLRGRGKALDTEREELERRIAEIGVEKEQIAAALGELERLNRARSEMPQDQQPSQPTGEAIQTAVKKAKTF